MIIAEAIFDRSEEESILNLLMSLPSPIKPEIFSSSEIRKPKGNLLTNKKKFNEFKEKNKLGYFLFATDVMYNLTLSLTRKSNITLWLDSDDKGELLLEFLIIISKAKIDFAFACNIDEYHHRNQFTIQLGENHIQGMVGRNILKYIPGLYWLTYISTNLVNKHNFNLEKAEQYGATTSYENGYLIKMFDKPQEWQEHMNKIDILCSELPELFSISVVKNAISNTMTFQEFQSTIHKWTI